MPRAQLTKAKKRVTIAFTLPGEELTKLDSYINRETERLPRAIISRQTVIESLVKEFLDSKESRPK